MGRVRFAKIAPLLIIAILILPFVNLTEGKSVSLINKTEKTVFNDSVTINIDVDLYSPCNLELYKFSKKWSPFQWKRLCNLKYEAIMIPLAEICPADEDEKQIFSEKENQQTINVNLALLVGYGSIFGNTSLHEGDISDIKLNLSNKAQMEKGEFLQSNEIREALATPFGKIVGVSLVDSFGMEWNALVALFAMYVFYTQEESWTNEKRIDNDFLKMIGIPNYKDAFGDVLLKPAGHYLCSINTEGSKMKVSFSLPLSSSNLNESLNTGLDSGNPKNKTKPFITESIKSSLTSISLSLSEIKNSLVQINESLDRLIFVMRKLNITMSLIAAFMIVYTIRLAFKVFYLGNL